MTSTNPITRLILASLLVIVTQLPGLAMAAGLEVHLDPTRVAEGETVVLSMSAPGDVSGTPDLAPLKKEFDLLDQSQSTHMSIINGHSSSTHEWRWVLAPKRSGKLSVPSIHLGGYSSEPLTLEVLPAAQASKLGEARPLLLEVEAKPKQPYVQGQVTYSVRVLSRVPLRQAVLSEPQAGDAIIERLGEDKQETTHRDGHEYQVIERRYAVFPQHSGKLEIAPPTLSAQIPEQGQHNGNRRKRMFGFDPFSDMDSFFGSDPFADMGGVFGQTRQVELRGRSVELAVKPQPAGAASPWLPAESLSLVENWSPNPPQFRVGEPVTRTIAITAQGLTAAQLPDLQAPQLAGVKVYPDKARSETRAEDDTLIAQKVLKRALVPSKSGKLVLPEIKLPWWDTSSNQSRVATLPARTVEVLPAAVGAPDSYPPVAQQGGNANPETAATKTPTGTALEPDSVASKLAGLGNTLGRESAMPAAYWPWVTLFLAVGWLVSTILWLKARKALSRTGAEPVTAAPATPPDASKCLGMVKQACNADDPRAARLALLDWASAHWPEDPPPRLDILARRLGREATEILQALDHALYAADDETWDGTSTWRRLAPLLDREKKTKSTSAGNSPLPRLYPQTT